LLRKHLDLAKRKGHREAAEAAIGRPEFVTQLFAERSILGEVAAEPALAKAGVVRGKNGQSSIG
jgi:hypothetical protein